MSIVRSAWYLEDARLPRSDGCIDGQWPAADTGVRFAMCNPADADADAAANEVEHGLGAHLDSRDIGRSWRAVEALDVGMVGVNRRLISTTNQDATDASQPSP